MNENRERAWRSIEAANDQQAAAAAVTIPSADAVDDECHAIAREHSPVYDWNEVVA